MHTEIWQQTPTEPGLTLTVAMAEGPQHWSQGHLLEQGRGMIQKQRAGDVLDNI